jgi:WD40 repeat protein
MSILDKQLPNTPIHRSRRKPILIIAALLALLVLVFACTNVSTETAFVDHFFTPPTHITYTGHSSYVSAVAWSPDGTHIASASGDGTVQVWDALTGGHVYTYRGHADAYWGHYTFGSAGAVNSVAWSPDGRHIVSGSSDTIVQVWQAP